MPCNRWCGKEFTREGSLVQSQHRPPQEKPLGARSSVLRTRPWSFGVWVFPATGPQPQVIYRPFCTFPIAVVVIGDRPDSDRHCSLIRIGTRLFIPRVSTAEGCGLRLRYDCCMRENYRAVLRGDRLEWQGDSPVTDGAAVAVEVTVLPDAPSRSEQGAKMAAVLERLGGVDAFSEMDDRVELDRNLREDRDLLGRD